MPGSERVDFEPAVEDFIRYRSQVNGHLRYEITRANLLMVLDGKLAWPRPMRVVDIGGGDGYDARWLAGEGNDVYLVEPSRRMYSRALGKEKRPLLRGILHGDANDAIGLYGEGSFQVAMSHAVIPYVEDPQQEIDSIARILEEGGVASVSVLGLYGKIKRLMREERYEELGELLETGFYSNRLSALEEKVWACVPEKMEEFLENAGLQTIDWFGINVEHDYNTRPIREYKNKKDELDKLYVDELMLSRNKERRREGQLLHFIAVKK